MAGGLPKFPIIGSAISQNLTLDRISLCINSIDNSNFPAGQYLFYSKNLSIWYKYQTLTSPWSDETLYISNASSSNVKIDDNGYPVISYIDASDNIQLNYYTNAVSTTTQVASSGTLPTVVIDGSDTYVFWVPQNSNNLFLNYAQSSENYSVVHQYNVSTPGNIDMMNIQVIDIGVWLFSFEVNVGGNKEIYIAKSIPGSHIGWEDLISFSTFIAPGKIDIHSLASFFYSNNHDLHMSAMFQYVANLFSFATFIVTVAGHTDIHSLASFEPNYDQLVLALGPLSYYEFNDTASSGTYDSLILANNPLAYYKINESTGSGNYNSIIISDGPVAYYKIDESSGSLGNYDSTVLSDTPFIYYKINESSGSIAIDSSGGGNNGSYNGSYTLHQSGVPNTGDYSITLNGTSGYVSATPYYHSIANSFSVEFWFQTSNYTQTCYFAEVGGLGIYLNGSGNIFFYAPLNPNGTSTGVPIPNDNKFHHYVMAFAGTNTTFPSGSIYLDGELIFSFSYTSPISLQAGQGIEFGSDGLGANFALGNFAEIAIYNYELSSTQVQNHFSGSFQTATDSSGNSHNGTYQGGYTLQQPGVPTTGDYSVALNGTSGLLAVDPTLFPDPPSLAASYFSIEFWFKTSNYTQTCYLAQLNGIGISLQNGEFYLPIASNGSIPTLINIAHDNNFHHYVLTINGFAAIPSWTGAFYIDGVEVFNNFNPTQVGGTYSVIAPTYGSNGQGGGFAVGNFAEAAIYNKVLTASQVSHHYSMTPYSVTAIDYSGNNHNGTYTGGFVLQQTGITGSTDKAITLDGTSGYISSPVLPYPFALEFWFKTSNFLQTATLVQWGGTQLFIQGGEIYTFDTGANHQSGPYGPVPQDNLFHHYIFQDNGTLVQVAIDGGLLIGGGARNQYIPADGLTFGSYTGNQAWVDGTFAEIAIYSGVLSQSDITNHYLIGAGASIATDSTSNHNDGTYFPGYTLQQPGVPAIGDYSATLDGISGKITSPVPTVNGDFTLEFWFKTSNYTQSGYLGQHTGCALYLVSGVLYYLGATGSPVNSGISIPNDNNFHYYVLSCSSSFILGYLDGTVLPGGGTVRTIFNAAQGISIGSDNLGGNFIQGNFAAFADYDFGLNQSQITAHYNAGT